MLILLPPSEGKTRPADGAPLDLGSLSFPVLTPVRELLLRTLVKMCAGNAQRAAEVLGLGPTQSAAVTVNAGLLDEPAARADEIYTGVLFSALDLASLDAASRQRADESIAIASALFGLVRPGDHIPAYRLSGTVSLPRLGPVAARWREPLPRVMTEAVGDGLLVDLRSGTYTALGKPPAELTDRTATMRVLHEQNGQRKVVSHFNKATKGRIVRGLMESGTDPKSIEELQDVLAELGWSVERVGNRLDVVVAEVALT
ncbi:YaaA family protein [Aeromicrobium wangtongii]|uniref:Peroxide stress protein YaaA n=1 Tax=Aeromicrobium wangtongii TaxID=2969247 RepID=A0ABY5MBT1_9ACTN|nr:peroxide stress protein YaaA [Aeromicrobium wangtongii]MCD9197418.1 peroxide stress protein YaaA [Aeromicrobium wangtongii]UUP14912.1 peroxide stress protein YaaA [Aeromicrobium wangtongii]